MTDDLLARHWPALLLAGACVGLAASPFVGIAPAAAVATAALAAVGATVTVGRPRLALLGLALACAGLAWGGLRLDAIRQSVLVDRLGTRASARAVVTSAGRRWGHAARVFAVVSRFGPEPVNERVLLELPDERAPPRGAVVELVRARPRAPRGPETGFDERSWLARRGVRVVVRADAVHVVGRRGGIGGVADRLRAHVLASLASGAEGERLALLRGIVLGDDGGLDSGLRDRFRRSGLAHLTAVSGQNIAIIALGLAAIGWLATIGRLGRQLVAICGILAYASAVGWEPSVARAAVAGTVGCVAVLASRRSDAWHALALGALVLLAWNPMTALDPGFQLSFVAVAAILVTVPRVAVYTRRSSAAARPAAWCAVAAACSVATAPLVWLHFGYVALWGIPANVAAEPAMPLVLGLALLGALVEPALPDAAASLTWLAGEAAAWIATCARFFGGLPHAELRSVHVLGWLAAAGVAAVAAVRLAGYRRTRALVTLASLAAVALGFWLVTSSHVAWERPAGLRVTFLDVGQGDAILVEAPMGAVLVDQGPPEAKVAQQLRRRGLHALSALVLTHPQRDHIGGAADVIRTLEVGAVVDPALAVVSEDSTRALAEARRRNVPVVVARAGEVLRLGRLTMRILWPKDEGRPDEDPNDHAVVILATYGSVDVLLTADAESNVTRRIHLGAAEVLKVAHHGSEDGGLPSLLRVLRPVVAVISVGRDNRFDHPRPETIAALESVPGLRVYRTDRDGAVVVESDGRSLSVSTGSGDAGR